MVQLPSPGEHLLVKPVQTFKHYTPEWYTTEFTVFQHKLLTSLGDSVDAVPASRLCTSTARARTVTLVL